jgi:hypothetical protein
LERVVPMMSYKYFRRHIHSAHSVLSGKSVRHRPRILKPSILVEIHKKLKNKLPGCSRIDYASDPRQIKTTLRTPPQTHLRF